MKLHPAFSFFLIILLFISSVQPVSAGSVDNGKQMIVEALDEFINYKTAKVLDENYGVVFGNTSEAEDLTPAQKIVYMIATAQQNPFGLKWVQETIASDVIWYYKALFWISVITFGLSMLQKYAPETVASISNRFAGHDDFIDYSVWFITICKLALLPIAAFPVIDGLIELEQTISSGLMQNAMEFLQVTGPGTGSVYFFEGIAYSICGWFFAFRIEFINFFAAHILKIIILFSIAWMKSHYIAQVLGEWFATALAMRPVVLWYSCLAVQHISNLYATHGEFNANYGITTNMSPNEAYRQVLSTTFDASGSVAITMSAVIVLSAITAAAAMTWPIFKVITKVIMEYLVTAIYKLIRINNALNSARSKT